MNSRKVRCVPVSGHCGPRFCWDIYKTGQLVGCVKVLWDRPRLLYEELKSVEVILSEPVIIPFLADAKSRGYAAASIRLGGNPPSAANHALIKAIIEVLNPPYYDAGLIGILSPEFNLKHEVTS